MNSCLTSLDWILIIENKMAADFYVESKDKIIVILKKKSHLDTVKSIYNTEANVEPSKFVDICFC